MHVQINSVRRPLLLAGVSLVIIAAFAFIVSTVPLQTSTTEMRIGTSGSSHHLERAALNSGDPAVNARQDSKYGKLPMSFEVNQGQTDKLVQFLARGAGYSLFLTPGEAVLALHAPPDNAGTPGDPASRGTFGRHPKQIPSTTPASIVRLQLIGANTAAAPIGIDRLPGNSNYLIGNDPARWQTDVPTYAKVRYSNVYPGIDLLYYGNQEGRLEHDFVVAPGADPNVIAIRLDGAERVELTAEGVSIHTGAGDVSLLNPTVYQAIGRQRKNVPGQYVLARNNELSVRIGEYDHTAPLVIDPVLKYSTLLSGNNLDYGYTIAVNSAGEAYVAGQTYSTNYPTNAALIASNPTSGRYWVDFVSKLNAAGTGLVFSTYVGGSDGESILFDIALDNIGAAYVSGLSTASDFPTTPGAYQTRYGGGNGDATITKLSSSGGLVYSTYVGGGDRDAAGAIAVDKLGNTYFAGGFPIPSNTFKTSKTKGLVVAKLDASGSKLLYSGILGGISPPPGVLTPWVSGIAVDNAGSAYVTGWTNDLAIANAFQPTYGGGLYDAFVTKISPAGDRLVYSTYLGGKDLDRANGIAVDSGGNAYLAGEIFRIATSVPDFPTTWNAFQNRYGGGSSDGFIFKLNTSGQLLYSSFLGGSGTDGISGIAVDQYKTVYVAGNADSPNFPLYGSIHPPGPGFITTLVPSGEQGKSIHYYSTGLGADIRGIAIDAALNVYVTGLNDNAAGLPVTTGAFQTVSKGGTDAFVSKLVIAADVGLAISASPITAIHGQNLTYTLSVFNKGPDWAQYVKVHDPIPPGTSFVSYNAGGGTCTAPAVGDSGALTCTLPRLNKGGAWDVQLVVKVNATGGSYIVNNGWARSNMQDFTTQNNNARLTTAVAGTATTNPVPYVNNPLAPDAAMPGGAGFTLTVNGTGFVPSSVVMWNGSPRATQFVNQGKLTVSVPAADIAKPGTASIQVVSPGPGGGKSATLFLSITKPSATVAFSRQDYESGVAPQGPFLSDLNGDRNLDLLVANHTFGDTISVFLGNGNGTLRPRTSYLAGGWPVAPIVADFNRDGKPDIAVSNYLDNTLSIYLGNGDGTLKAQVTYPTGTSPYELATADFNGDGKLDLAAPNSRAFNPGPSTISVLLGNGDGTFGPQTQFAVGATPAVVLAGDFNRDGRVDLAVANNDSNNVSVLLGNGDGTFQKQVQYPVAAGPQEMEMADLNGDGILDLVTNNYDDGTVSVLLGNGDGTFRVHKEYVVGGTPRFGAVGDLNGDGKLDLAIGARQNYVSVLFGKGDGTFQNVVQYPQARPTLSVAIGDLNGDGKLDLVTTNANSEYDARVSVLLQTPTP